MYKIKSKKYKYNIYNYIYILMESNARKQSDDFSEDFSEEKTGDSYQFTTKVNRTLSKVLGIDDIKEFQIGDYEPYDVPKEHGLSNCNIIIPSYYNLYKHPSKIFDIDYYEIIKDDIRNCRTLNEYQLQYIKGLSHEQKNEIFDIFNCCTKLYNEVFNV